MKLITTKWVSAVLAIGLLAFAGCGKSDKDSAKTGAAKIDLPKFQQTFPSPTPAQQSCLEKVTSGVRYRLYPQALASLETLASDPAITEPQKKAVADLVEGIKQAMASTPAAPAQ